MEAEDRQVLSIESQMSEAKELANKDAIILDEKFSESMSAKKPGRPIFKKMIDYIVKHKGCTIYTWKIDRLARNAKDGGEIINLMDEEYIKQIKTFGKTYNNTSEDKFMMNLEFGMAKKYVDDLSVNVKRGIRAKLNRGEWPNMAPLGYINDRNTKNVAPCPQQASYVVEMFNLYSTGKYGVRELTKIMYEKGLRTKGGRGKVGKTVIHKSLNNTFYYGLMEKDGKYYNGTYETLIDKELFDKVSDIINGRHRIRPKKRFFPCRGFLKCHVCGCSLTATMKKGFSYYYCTNGKGNCEQHKKYLRSEEVENFISNIFEDLRFDEEMIEIMYLSSIEKLKHKNKYAETALKRLENALKLTQERQSRLIDSYLSKNTPKALYEQKIKQLENEETEIKLQIKKISKKGKKEKVTLERTKKYFLTASRAKKEFLEKEDENKRGVLEKLLWNAFFEDQKLANFKLKNPYQLMLGVSNKCDFEILRKGWDSNPRSREGQRFSRPSLSTTQTPFHF